ncbi:MAG: HlyC/CorC family transporter [Actinomycetales bacterium]|jgi:CBS domain containing-hemolysin-like protein|uniref:HlyC/CorC family transporter n=1 Tax=Candidatus Phosphoribacter hodrii TaxID=2953743 RepID=A0A935II67_9MICO|nr:HlyC/CorC family transporter [Candidatus Phosphoribacter hodrii]OPZ55767.1 MAG: Magnesium and cobalt efflux protein CorC [bacterium ADurb.BinA028]HNV13222.1 hemolysin family protein [Dermatophilaceae bacterium]MBK7271651.1 HlyC/CorC family transporter [Candidatus Phosphoribacter hodrii]HOA01434.1 hemolysin family protein [Dermatophilaceae bacterium]
MSHSMALWISLGLLLANAFFVGAEFAAMAARRSALEPLAAAGSARAATCLAALEQMGSMLATAQLGITVCSVGLGALAEAALHEVLHPVFAALPLGEAWANGLSFAGALLIVVYLHVVAGEMIPKNLALAGPERAALVLVPALLMVSRVLRPVVAVMEWVAKGLVRAIFRIEPKDEIASAFTVEEVTHILAESEREGLIEEHREGLVRSALEFSAKLAADVAVPVDRLVTVAKGVTPEDVERLVARTGFSRYPFLDKEGHVAGYLHLKDILYAADAAARTERVPRKRLRRLATVAPTEEIEDVLATMRGNGTHLARVVDPTGEVIGVIFLEDIVEELVGTISDAETR